MRGSELYERGGGPDAGWIILAVIILLFECLFVFALVVYALSHWPCG